MRSSLMLVCLVSLFEMACGTDGGAAEPRGEIAAPQVIPARPLPGAARGGWSMTRFWSEGRTDGPSFWSKALIDEERITLQDGERSKDSGGWTVSGRYEFVGGAGTEEDPFLARMAVDQARGDDFHPAPATAGETVGLRIVLAGDRIRIQLPRGSIEGTREGGAN